ncbi:unnamed protein product [Symbiodinium sp. CCMP2592]|nr:unnamed protein product [Symbiodinium sp. CCMP2592]
MRKEMRLYRCWTAAREIELEIDEISFSYEREAQGPSAEALAAESGGTGSGEGDRDRETRESQRKAAKTVKAKTTEALAKTALQNANSNMLEIRGYRQKALVDALCESMEVHHGIIEKCTKSLEEGISTGAQGQDLETLVLAVGQANGMTPPLPITSSGALEPETNRVTVDRDEIKQYWSRLSAALGRDPVGAAECMVPLGGQMKRYPLMTIREWVSFGLRTWAPALRVMAWSYNILVRGVNPTVGFNDCALKGTMAKRAGFAVDLTRTYERRSSEDVLRNCMAQPLRNPLTTDLLEGVFQPYQIRACAMHVVNLGVLQSHSGSVMDLLLGRNFFGNHADLADALQIATTRFKRYASSQHMTHSVMLTTGILTYVSGFPSLNLKALNGRVFLSFLAVCLRAALASNPADVEVNLAEQATRTLVVWYQQQECSPRLMEPGPAKCFLQTTNTFLKLTSGLARLALKTGTFRWKLLPKHHVSKP